MSIADDNYDDDYDEQPDESSVIKQLRKQQRDQAAELKTLREQAEQAAVLAKENALYKANLGELNEAQQKAVLALAADATPEAFRQQAEALGFIEAPQPTVPVDDLEAFDRTSQATAGGTELNEASFDAEIRGTRNEQEWEAVMLKYNKSFGTPTQ